MHWLGYNDAVFLLTTVARCFRVYFITRDYSLGQIAFIVFQALFAAFPDLI